MPVAFGTLQKHMEYVVVTDDAEARDICEYLKGFDLLALDTETYANGKKGPDAYYNFDVPKRKEARLWVSDPWINNIRLIQIRSRESDSFLFDLNQLGETGREALRDLFSQEHIEFILQNAKFDYKMLAVNLDVRLPKIYDVMIAARCIGYATGDQAASARGWGLKDLCRDYLGVKLSKEEQGSNWGAAELTESQLQYAADDLLYLFDLYDLFCHIIKHEYGMEGGVRIEMEVLPVVCDLELAGLNLDKRMYLKIQEAAKAYLPQLEEKVCQFIGWPMISPPMSVRLKTGRTRIPKPMNLAAGNSPLDSNPLMVKSFRAKGIPVDNLQGDHLENFFEAHPVIEDFSKYKDLAKQLSNDYLEWVHPVTGKLHHELDQMGAATGRFTAKNPNMQQVSKFDVEVPENMIEPWMEKYRDSKDGKIKLNYRFCFVAPLGWKFCSADYSSQEIRVMAVLSGDKNLIQVYHEPEKVLRDGKMVKNMAADPYAMTAELMWGKTHGVTCWTAKTMIFPGTGKDFRSMAKVITLGNAYGKTAPGMAKDWGIPEKEAESLIRLYFQPFSGLEKWLDEQGSIGAATGMCIFGRTDTDIIRYRMLKSSRHSDAGAAERAAKNTPIQGSSALMVKLAMIEHRKQFKGSPAILVLSVHDELGFITPEELLEDTKERIGQTMRIASDFFLRGIVPSKYGIGVDDCWSKD